MERSFQDRNFLVWEVYSSGGRHGFSARPHIIFNCLTQPVIRSRWIPLGEDTADSQRRIAQASDAELLGMLESAPEIP